MFDIYLIICYIYYQVKIFFTIYIGNKGGIIMESVNTNVNVQVEATNMSCNYHM